MVRKSRSDKKDTTCKCCGKEPIQPPIQMPIQISIQTPPIQESNQQPIQEAIQKPVQIPNKDILFNNSDIEWSYKKLKTCIYEITSLSHKKVSN
ncbi:2996_t:CDS:2, partial [Funneliformis geosporum]